MDFFEIKSDKEFDQVRIEREQKKRQEFTFLGSERVVRGHTMFSFNVVTKEIKVAALKHCDTFDLSKMDVAYNPKIIVEENCVYRQALNKKNLIKRLKREGFAV